VIALLVSPLAGGLFQRAVSQSGGTWSNTPEQAEAAGEAQSSQAILQRLFEEDAPGSGGAALASHTPLELAAYLRGLSVERLYAAYQRMPEERYDPPRVFRDGAVLPEQPFLAALGTPGARQPVPVLLGSNRDEQKLFAFVDPAQVRNWFGVLPRARDPQAYQRDNGYRSRAWKVTGVDDPARQLVRTEPGRVFAYRFDWDEEPRVLGSDLGFLIGAAHGLEIPFVFGHWNLGKAGERLFPAETLASREALAAQVMSYWAEFAWRGDPDRGRDGALPAWTAWQGDGPKYLVLDSPAGGGVRMAAGSERLADVAAAILADPSYPDAAARCRALASLDDWTADQPPHTDYAADATACASVAAGGS
jgi:para-nitrobenzyl esterase